MKKIIINGLIVIFALIFIFSAFKISKFFIDLNNNKKMNEEIIEKFIKIEEPSVDDNDEDNNEKITVDFGNLLNINSDVRGWIMFNGNKVNNPITQSSDNNYYLDHSIYKTNNSLGTIFMDHRNLSFDDRNVVLFGHNSTDGSMFGSLKETLEDSFFNKYENSLIKIIDTDNTIKYYEIFSVYTIVKEEYYITTNFNSDEEFMKFLTIVKGRSIKDFKIDLSATDKVLTLSTCDGVGGTDRRLVVHARLKTDFVETDNIKA